MPAITVFLGRLGNLGLEVLAGALEARNLLVDLPVGIVVVQDAGTGLPRSSVKRERRE